MDLKFNFTDEELAALNLEAASQNRGRARKLLDPLQPEDLVAAAVQRYVGGLKTRIGTSKSVLLASVFDDLDPTTKATVQAAIDVKKSAIVSAQATALTESIQEIADAKAAAEEAQAAGGIAKVG